MREIKVEGSGWIAIWLFCITLNTCDGASALERIDRNLDKLFPDPVEGPKEYAA